MKTKTSKIDLMRPRDLYEKAKLLRERDGVDFYLRKGRLFREVGCVACGSKRAGLRFYKCGFRHVECSRCGTLFVSPRPAEKDLLSYYSDFEAPLFWTQVLLNTDSERKVIQYAPRAKMLVDACRANMAGKDTVFLDVGAGSGNFALAVKQEDYFSKVTALDVSGECVSVCRRKGLDAFRGTLSDYRGKADCLAMNDLIEHVFSPEDMLREARKKLNPGGILMIATPNCLGLDFSLFGKDTDNVTPPEHVQYFNPKSISVLFKRTGFSVLDVSTPGILDLAIVERKVRDGYALESGSYISRIIKSGGKTKDDFQAFLQRNRLSSHMVAYARRAG
ncbi:MAG: class I SAM-dependent methyltransferase [Candidatus Omnitrophota bacterium]